MFEQLNGRKFVTPEGQVKGPGVRQNIQMGKRVNSPQRPHDKREYEAHWRERGGSPRKSHMAIQRGPEANEQEKRVAIGEAFSRLLESMPGS